MQKSKRSITDQRVKYKTLENSSQLKFDMFFKDSPIVESPIYVREKKVQENKEQVPLTYLDYDLIDDFGEILKIK